jgi:hypothetical protein
LYLKVIIFSYPTHLVLMSVEECEPFVNTVIAFYVASLPDVVGHSWRSPSLPFLARYWLHPAGKELSFDLAIYLANPSYLLAEIRLAARAIFGAAAGRLSDEETIHFVEYWQHACMLFHYIITAVANVV